MTRRLRWEMWVLGSLLLALILVLTFSENESPAARRADIRHGRALPRNQAIALTIHAEPRSRREPRPRDSDRQHKILQPGDGWHIRFANSWPCTTWNSPYRALMLHGDYDCISWVESAVYNCRTASSVTITLRTWFTPGTRTDYTAALQISTDGGKTWAGLRRYGQPVRRVESLDVSHFAARQSRVRLRWYYAGPTQSLDAWAFDDFVLSRQPVMARDVAVEQIIFPQPRIPAHLRFVPTIQLANMGCHWESLTAGFEIPGVCARTWRGCLGYGEHRSLEFDSVQLPPGVTRTMRAWAHAVTDMCHENDTFADTLEALAAEWWDQNPQFSPAGQELAWVRRDTVGWYEICRRVVAETTVAVMVQRDLVLETPRWSPDGSALVYTLDGQVGVSRTDASPPRALTGSCCSNPQWSPDGSRIACVERDRASNRILLVTPDTGAVQVLTPDGDWFSPRWSPDGQWLAGVRYDNRRLRIWKLNVRTREAMPVSGEDAHYVFPRWSHDGRWIVCERTSAGGRSRICRFGSDGKDEMLLTPGDVSCEYPSFSAQDEWILFTRSEGRNNQVCRVRSAGGEVVPLTRGATIKRDPEWSPDDQWIVYTEQAAGRDQPTRLRQISPV